MFNRMNRIVISLIFLGCFLFITGNPLFCEQGIPRSGYLEYARKSADWTWEHYDESIRKWKKRFDPENV